MAGFEEYSRYDGLGLAALVRQGEVSPAELAAAAFDAIERVNPKLNAVIRTMEAHAEATLREGPAEGPFRGVPFLAKDLMTSYAGIPTGGACRLTQGFTRDWDSDLVTRFKASGVVTVGKTNTPELGMNASAEPVLTGAAAGPRVIAPLRRLFGGCARERRQGGKARQKLGDLGVADVRRAVP